MLLVVCSPECRHNVQVSSCRSDHCKRRASSIFGGNTTISGGVSGKFLPPDEVTTRLHEEGGKSLPPCVRHRLKTVVNIWN
jgi:hypothetical protein